MEITVQLHHIILFFLLVFVLPAYLGYKFEKWKHRRKQGRN